MGSGAMMNNLAIGDNMEDDMTSFTKTEEDIIKKIQRGENIKTVLNDNLKILSLHGINVSYYLNRLIYLFGYNDEHYTRIYIPFWIVVLLLNGNHKLGRKFIDSGFPCRIFDIYFFAYKSDINKSAYIYIETVNDKFKARVKHEEI